MTDNEIIKELQAASEWYKEHGRNTNAAIVGICERAIDHINRQKAEINKQDAKIEELKYMLGCYALQYGTVRGQRRVLNQTRTKAVKELVNIINEKIALFTDEGSEEYASGVHTALDWYDAKMQEALVDYAKKYSLDIQNDADEEVNNGLLKEFAKELVDKSAGGQSR